MHVTSKSAFHPHSTSWHIPLPHSDLSLLSLSGPIGFVNISANMSSVGQYLRHILPLLTCSHTK